MHEGDDDEFLLHVNPADFRHAAGLIRCARHCIPHSLFDVAHEKTQCSHNAFCCCRRMGSYELFHVDDGYSVHELSRSASAARTATTEDDVVSIGGASVASRKSLSGGQREDPLAKTISRTSSRLSRVSGRVAPIETDLRVEEYGAGGGALASPLATSRSFQASAEAAARRRSSIRSSISSTRSRRNGLSRSPRAGALGIAPPFVTSVSVL